MVSIRPNAYPDLLPDFRNLGVIARILLAVNAAVLAGALFASADVARRSSASSRPPRSPSRCCW